MEIKDYADTERYYPSICLEYESLITCQAIELHK